MTDDAAVTFSPAMEKADHYTGWLIDTFAGYLRGRLLEVGVGHGGFRRHFAGVEHYVGLDVDGELLAAARGLYDGDGGGSGEYVQASVTDPELPDRLGAGSFDAVVCWNVLEHLEEDAAAVANMVRLLAPGGHLLLQVPALEALFNDLDRLAGHLRRYRRSEVRALLPATVEVVRLDYFNPAGAVGWWLNRFVRHRDLAAAPVARQVEIFDRLVLPLSRLADPLTRGFFGQSVLCVARKP